ncbi:hypothetical protein [Saccharibacter floricola]|nr:hypothetical protein [Saccharibacter floricola]
MAQRPASRRNTRSPYAHLNGARMGDDNQDTLPPKADENTPDDLPPEETTGEDDDTQHARHHRGETPDPDDDTAQSDDDLDAEDERDDEDDRKAEEGDDDDDRTVREDAKARASSRAHAILRRPEAAHNLALACHIAFNTTMTRMQAVAALRAASCGSRRSRRASTRHTSQNTTASLRSRMASHAVRPLKADAGQPKSSLQSRVAAFNKRLNTGA